ncbi:TPA: hypothetical protein ACVOZF_001585 [Vibrio diabolicus]
MNPRYETNAGDNASAGDGFVIHLPGGKLADFKKVSVVIKQARDAFSGGEFSFLPLVLNGFFTASLFDCLDVLIQLSDQRFHRSFIGKK